MQREVVVWGKRVPLEVEKRSGAHWIARGAYRGQPLEAEARSEGSALAEWRRLAECCAN
jgi:hypothetical protein